jgi:hypothetical protein
MLQKSDVNIHYDNNGYPASVSFTLRHYKNMANDQPTTKSISGQTNRDLCPGLALHIYLTTFNPKMGPLAFFQFQDGSPVKHNFVAGQLSHILKFLGFKPKIISRAFISDWRSYPYRKFRDPECRSLELECGSKIH